MAVRSKRKIAVGEWVVHAYLAVVSLLFILPLWAVISISISDEVDITKYGFSLIPRNLDFTSYRYIFESPATILNAYKVTIIVSGAALVLYLLVSSMAAYALSRSNFKYGKAISFYLFFTMLFNGGLVPYYILMNQYLHLRNSYLALILPLIGNVWYIFIMRTNFRQIPDAIVESAKIDGAGELQIYYKIILPLSKPVLATVGLLQLLANWNAWFQAMLFIDKSELYPLQYLLQTILRNAQELSRGFENSMVSFTASQPLPTESMRMAMAVIATGPMLLIFPFFQKYFVKGLTVGSVKG
ncbi:carbohydrate ABC transporter permease [Cohnella fermenti]|uniref:Carbohydrate ABC transporter permease n=1 Tax=Cohnella fermenti TaxID=2565925 RepID=A0A4S4BNZ7_9BACL|nr:carbohydrate ABC transporter permease [Cohnella fermenti]THF76575.1 carbohydrate ABC transporter permease [Cohnella fermenti]